MKHKREEVERNTRDSHSDLGLSLVIYSPLSVLSLIALVPLGKKNIEQCVSGMSLVRARHLKGRENKRRGAEGSLCDCGVRRAPRVRAPAFVERSRTVAFFYFLLYPAKSIRPDRHVICPKPLRLLSVYRSLYVCLSVPSGKDRVEPYPPTNLRICRVM